MIFYSIAAQDPSVIAPDATIACNQASFSSVAKNLGRNSLEDDARGVINGYCLFEKVSLVWGGASSLASHVAPYEIKIYRLSNCSRDVWHRAIVLR